MATVRKLPIWFMNRLKKVMEHNDYEQDMITTKVCTPKDRWTPTDLIIREVYNNGGGSSKGFLGLTKAQTLQAFDFIRDNQETLKEMDYYNEKGFNNFGLPLWKNWELR